MILSKTYFTKHCILYIMLLMKSDHKIKQAVAFLSPVSSLCASNAWDHEPRLATKQVVFYDSGFPMQALVIIAAKFTVKTEVTLQP